MIADADLLPRIDWFLGLIFPRLLTAQLWAVVFFNIDITTVFSYTAFLRSLNIHICRGGCVQYKRMSAKEELKIAREIIACEQAAREALSFDEMIAAMLVYRPTGSERTRAGAVDRLEEVVKAVAKKAQENPSLKGPALEAERALRRAQELRWKLALSAIRIAKGEARKYAGLIAAEDLVHEGILGLLKAAKRFDPAFGYRFGTYASWWARAEITRAINTTGRTVRLPGDVVEGIRHVHQMTRRFDTRSVDWDNELLATELGCTTERVRLLLHLDAGVVFSLEYEAEEGVRYGDILFSDALSPDAELIRARSIEWLRSRIHNGSHVLTDRQRRVLQLNFGLDGVQRLDMAKVARGIGLSRERIRQIRLKALEKLRESA